MYGLPSQYHRGIKDLGIPNNHALHRLVRGLLQTSVVLIGAVLPCTGLPPHTISLVSQPLPSGWKYILKRFCARSLFLLRSHVPRRYNAHRR